MSLRTMNRQTLNGLQPRTARELWRDLGDWWEGPAEPQFVANVIETDNRLIARFGRWIGRLFHRRPV